MKKELLTLNSPNKNLRTYSTKEINKSIDDTKEYPLFAKMFISPVHKPAIPIGSITNLFVEDDSLIGVAKVDEKFLHLLDDAAVRPQMTGYIKDGVVTDIKIQSFYLTDDPA